ncbi:MAG: hypothetical protein E5Y89_05985, partial [Mesorhizobium sp.]
MDTVLGCARRTGGNRQRSCGALSRHWPGACRARALLARRLPLGLNLQWGLTGLFNVGLAGFVAIGAYT